jgi:geranyl-CoA carboxylase beta subunit
MTIPANKKGKEVDKKVMRKQRLAITDDFKRQSSAFYTSGRLFDMGIIYPCDTRKILRFCLKNC